MATVVMQILVFCLLTNVLLADRTSLKIYEQIQGDYFCFRRLNATHQIGCSSDRSGNVGVVHLVENPEDMKWITEKGPYPPYIAVLPLSYFTLNNMTELQLSGRVSGVMVLKTGDIPEAFSPDQSCPNQNFGLYPHHEQYARCQQGIWNPPNPVLGIMYENWDFPIFLITKEDSISKIKDDCFNKFNKPKNGETRTWPLCSARLRTVMLAAKDTSTCMRRSNLVTNLNPAKLCDPLSGRNIATMLFPKTKYETVPKRSVIVVGARLDSFSMYDQLAPGAHSSITGLVTLLSVAYTMAKLKENSEIHSNLGKDVLFAIFNGETFDYIGSSRMVYDMREGDFPPNNKQKNIMSYSLEHISHFIELSQLSSADDVWLHVDELISQNVTTSIQQLIDDLKQANTEYKNISMNKVPGYKPLPPASMQSFLKYDKQIAGVLIADHQNEFINKYYNSFYDNEETLNITENLKVHLASTAAIVSKTLYKMLTGKIYTNDLANVTLVEELLKCYLVNASCDLFRQISDPDKIDKLKDGPYTLYIGVESSPHYISYIAQYTLHLLSYLTGEHLEDRTRENCTEKNDTLHYYSYSWMAGPNLTGICVKSTVFYTTAVSPAFVLKDWHSTEYSTWTESVWEEVTVSIFLQPSRVKEAMTLVSGCIITVVSFIIVYFANKRASILFGARNLVGC